MTQTDGAPRRTEGAGPLSLGLVGLGAMGAPLALRLLDQGVALRVLTGRSAPGVAAAVAAGAEPVADPAVFGSGLDALLTCLPDAEAVAAVHAEIAPGLPRGALCLDLTTGLPQATRALAAEAQGRGLRFADAPVTGLPAAARAGRLVSMVGCAAEDWSAVAGICALYSMASHRLGDVAQGHAAKLVNNTITQGTLALLADAFALARSQGLDLETLAAVLTSGAARSGILEAALPSVLAGPADGVPFAIAHSAKDLAYAERAAGGATGPMLHAAAAVLAAHVAAGRGARRVSELLGSDVTPPSTP